MKRRQSGPCAGQSQDSTASWTYNSTTWRQANNNASNRVTWLDGGADTNIEAQYLCNILEGSISADFGQIGVNFNATTGAPSVIGFVGYTGGNGMGSTVITLFQGTLGLNFAQAMEKDSTHVAGTATFFGNAFQILRIHLEY